MTITYTRDIPDPRHNPSQDVGGMKQNTNSIDDIIDVDHYSFNDTVFSGLHKQIRFVTQAAPPTALGQLALYSKLTGGSSQLFLIRDNVAGTEVALTPNPGVIGNMLSAQNGYSWLPGNVLLQWGFDVIAAFGNTVINFSVSFSALWLPIIVVTSGSNLSSVDLSIIARAQGNFTIHNPGGSLQAFWMAIGPI